MSLQRDHELVIRPSSVVSLADLRDIWRFRELLWTLAMRDVQVRYKQAAFGVLWAILQPLAQVAIFTLLFNRLAGMRSDMPVSYPLFAFSGVVIWSLFATGLAQASNSLVENARIITKVYFPRVLIPLGSIIVACVDFAIALGLLLVVMMIGGTPLQPTLAFVPVLGLLAGLFAFAIGLWTSAINIRFRDVRYALPFFLQLLIFLTPVFYSSSLIPGEYRFLLHLNPMAAIVDGFRAALFGGDLPWLRLASALAATTVVGCAGFIYFRRVEDTFADRV